MKKIKLNDRAITKISLFIIVIGLLLSIFTPHPYNRSGGILILFVFVYNAFIV